MRTGPSHERPRSRLLSVISSISVYPKVGTFIRPRSGSSRNIRPPKATTDPSDTRLMRTLWTLALLPESASTRTGLVHVVPSSSERLAYVR